MSETQSLPDNIAELYNIEAGIEAALQGKSHKQIAEAMGLKEWNYYKLRSRHTLFRDTVNRARHEGLEVLKESVLTLVDENAELSPQLVKIKADLLLWYLKVSDPAQFGDRMTIREEHVDLKGALLDAKTRVINVSQTSQRIDPFED